MRGSVSPKRDPKTGRPKAGVWVVRWEAGKQPRRQRKETVHGTKTEAEARLAKHLAEAAAGGPRWDPTLGEFIERHFLPAYRDRVKPTTWRTRAGWMRRLWLPALGAVKLADLTPLMVQRVLDDFGRGHRPSTVGAAHSALSVALAEAARLEAVSRNVCVLVRAPAGTPRERLVWTPDQAQQFLDAHDATTNGPLWETAIGTSARIGEITCLRWEDLDLEAGTWRVERTETLGADGRRTIGPPKTRASRRVIWLSDRTRAALRRQRARQNERRLAAGPIWRDEGWVFDRGDGERLTAAGARRAFAAAIAASGLPRMSLHGLRHLGGALMVRAGVHPKVVADRLGNTVEVAMRVYAHASTELQTVAAGAVDAALTREQREA